MSWLFSRALVAEYLEGSYWDGDACAALNVMPTQSTFLLNGKTMEPSRLSRFGLTCELLTEKNGEELLKWFRAGSRVRTYRAPVKGRGLPEQKADSGKKWRGLFAMYDPPTFSWKTAQCSLLEDLALSSRIWPRWGMTQGGECLEQTRSAQIMSASAFGLLRNQSRAKRLTEMTMGGFAPGAEENFSLSASATTANGNATTAANGHTRFIMKNGTVARHAAPLMWPTPQANEDAAGTVNGNMQRMLTHAAKESIPLETQNGGQLNPTWVDWIMGFPIGYTGLESLATPKSRLQQQQPFASLARVYE